MALNNTELSVVLEEINMKQVADTVNRAAVLKNLLPSATGEINARGVNVFAKTSSNYAMKWFAEGGTYPAGGNSARVKMTSQFKRLAISSQMTRDVLEGADKRAIINVISEEVTDDTITATQELSQQLYGNGSGVKAVVDSVSSLDVTFQTAYDVSPDNADAYTSQQYGTGLLKANAVYNFIGGSVRGGVAAVGQVLDTGGVTDFTLNSITSGSVGAFAAVPTDDALADGDMLVYAGSYGIAVHGLDYHISSGTGTYQNVSRNTYPSLRCYVLNAANSALTVAFLYKLIFQAKYLRNQDITDEQYIILSSPTQVHQYALLANISTAGVSGNTNLNVMPDGKKLDYGFRSFEFMGLKWVEDPHAPSQTIYIILPSKFKIHEFKSLSAVPLGGDSGFAPVPAFTSAGVGSYTDNAVYTMTWKGNLVTNDPQKAGLKLTNLATSGLANIASGYALT